jgi:hypothetical protein
LTSFFSFFLPRKSAVWEPLITRISSPSGIRRGLIYGSTKNEGFAIATAAGMGAGSDPSALPAFGSLRESWPMGWLENAMNSPYQKLAIEIRGPNKPFFRF